MRHVAIPPPCLHGLHTAGRRTPSSPPLGSSSAFIRAKCPFTGLGGCHNMLLAGGVDTHNSAGILHCCPASSYDCGGEVTWNGPITPTKRFLIHTSNELLRARKEERPGIQKLAKRYPAKVAYCRCPSGQYAL